MTAAVYTVAKPADVGTRSFKIGNRSGHFRDITADTGTYTTGGFTVTASQLGLKRVDICLCGSAVATQGTAGAGAVGVGERYAADGTSVTFQFYESATSAAPFLEKDNAEAIVANLTFRVMAIGQ